MALLHQILQDAIANSGLNKGDFAKACGLSRTSLFHILNGTSLPKKPTLNRISKVLKKDQEFLKHLDQLARRTRHDAVEVRTDPLSQPGRLIGLDLFPRER